MGEESTQLGENKTILLVEDDFDVRDVTNFILRQMGFEVIEVGTGAEALKVIESDVAIDMLLSDIGLPGGMNGAELVQQALVSRPTLPALLVSAYDDDSLLQFGATNVNATVLRKPYLQEDLQREIEKTLTGTA